MPAFTEGLSRAGATVVGVGDQPASMLSERARRALAHYVQVDRLWDVTAMERTLRQPTFQPPGSVFKAFVAAYALEHGLDPNVTVNCTLLPGETHANYNDLRCWSKAVTLGEQELSNRGQKADKY